MLCALLVLISLLLTFQNSSSFISRLPANPQTRTPIPSVIPLHPIPGATLSLNTRLLFVI